MAEERQRTVRYWDEEVGEVAEAGEELPEGREMKRAEPVEVKEGEEVVMVELDKVGEAK